jgi:hypothetical protein
MATETPPVQRDRRIHNLSEDTPMILLAGLLLIGISAGRMIEIAQPTGSYVPNIASFIIGCGLVIGAVIREKRSR